MTLKVVLVDDERPAIERLKKLLVSHPELKVVGEASDGVTALTLIDQRQPDVVFLDIEMPELSGLEVARTLSRTINPPAIVFATAYDEFALAAFDAAAIDYIVKPINPQRLAITVEKLLRHRAPRSAQLNAAIEKIAPAEEATRFAVKIGSKYEVINPLNISAVLAKDHYSALIVGGRELLCDDSLDTFTSRLDPQIFIRVHRSAILNSRFLKGLRREGDRKFVALLADHALTEVAISRERLPQVRKFLGLES